MNRPLLFLLLLMLLAACGSDSKSKGKQPPEMPLVTADAGGRSDFLIVPGERIGMLTGRSTEAQLRAAYGPEEVKISDISLGEGETQTGLVVLPESPNELEIMLDVAAATGNPHFVRISQENTQWHTEEGITVGSTLAELEAANGNPFTLYGFEWDLAGLVISWRGGRYSSNLVLALIPGNPEALTPALLGEVELSSDDPALKELDLRVGSIVVMF